MSDNEGNKILSMDVYKESAKEIFRMVNEFDRLLVITKTNLNEKRKHFLEEQWHDLRLHENQMTVEKRKIIARIGGGVL